MKENQFLRQGSRGCFVSLVSIFFAIFLMAISANDQHPENPACGGMLGGGSPALFICDNWGGGSPTGSWGKIDFVDVMNGGIRPWGLLLDFLFYLVLIWIGLLLLARVFRNVINHSDFWWTTFILVGFLSGFLCAFLTFQASDFSISRYYVRTPTPVIPSPTFSETMPAMTTPNATQTP